MLNDNSKSLDNLKATIFNKKGEKRSAYSDGFVSTKPGISKSTNVKALTRGSMPSLKV